MNAAVSAAVAEARSALAAAPPAPRASFIRAAEVWVPSTDRTLLEFGGGLYGQAHRFAAMSRHLCFGRGEGLPGQAWEQGRPIVLKSFDGSYFRRTAAAHAEGITCGIAVPIFAGDFLTSVLVLFCGDDAGSAGAIELWHHDPGSESAPRDLVLDDGCYGRTGDAFEFTSRRTSFRRGNGLPGTAWDTGLPEFVENMGKASRFLRADEALKVGINRGFALPCPVRGEHTWVLAFLSALDTPIARRFEVWLPDVSRERLLFAGGFCESSGALTAGEGSPVLDRGQGTIGKVYLTGVPALSDNPASEPDAVGRTAAGLGLGSLVVIPVIHDGRLAAAAAWYF